MIRQMSIEDFVNVCTEERDNAIEEQKSIVVTGGYNDFSYFSVVISPNELSLDEKNIFIHQFPFSLELDLSEADLFRAKDDAGLNIENCFYIFFKNRKDVYDLDYVQNNYDIAIDFV